MNPESDLCARFIINFQIATTLPERRRGGRGPYAEVYRKPAVDDPGKTSKSPHPWALKPLSAANRGLSIQAEPTGFQPESFTSNQA